MKTINVDLTKFGSLNELNQQITNLTTDLTVKCRIFVDRLADAGIRIAKLNEGEFKDKIFYTKEVDFKDKHYKLVLRFTGEEIERVWEVKNGVHSEIINSLLMAEFGSGKFANSGWSNAIPEVGQGTLNKYGHAFDPDGWYWRDIDGLHHSYGTTPSYPVYSAYMEMKTQIGKIAKEVFGNA